MMTGEALPRISGLASVSTMKSICVHEGTTGGTGVAAEGIIATARGAAGGAALAQQVSIETNRTEQMSSVDRLAFTRCSQQSVVPALCRLLFSLLYFKPTRKKKRRRDGPSSDFPTIWPRHSGAPLSPAACLLQFS